MLVLRRGVGSGDSAASSVVPVGNALARLVHSAVQSASSRAYISKNAPHCPSLNIKVQQRVEASRLKQRNVQTPALFACAWVGTGHAAVVRRAWHMHSSRALSSGAEDTQTKVKHEVKLAPLQDTCGNSLVKWYTCYVSVIPARGKPSPRTAAPMKLSASGRANPCSCRFQEALTHTRSK